MPWTPVDERPLSVVRAVLPATIPMVVPTRVRGFPLVQGFFLRPGLVTQLASIRRNSGDGNSDQARRNVARRGSNSSERKSGRREATTISCCRGSDGIRVSRRAEPRLERGFIPPHSPGLYQHCAWDDLQSGELLTKEIVVSHQGTRIPWRDQGVRYLGIAGAVRPVWIDAGTHPHGSRSGIESADGGDGAQRHQGLIQGSDPVPSRASRMTRHPPKGRIQTRSK